MTDSRKPMPTEKVTNMAEFADSYLLQFFSFLGDSQNLRRASLVSHQFHRISKDETLKTLPLLLDYQQPLADRHQYFLSADSNAHITVLKVLHRPDGWRMVSADESGKIRIWNPRTQVCEQVLEHGCKVHSLLVFPDGSIVSGGGPIVGVWDISEDGQYTCRIKGQVSENGCGELISMSTNNEICFVFYAHPGIFRCRLFPDKKGECELIAKTWQYTESTVYVGRIDHLAVMPIDNVQHIVSSFGIGINIWNCETGECIKTFTSAGLVSSLKVIELREGWRIFAGTGHGTIEQWNPLTGNCEHIFQGPPETIDLLELIQPQGYIVCGTGLGNIRVWDLHTRECVGTIEPDGRKCAVKALAVAPNGRLMTSQASSIPRITLWAFAHLSDELSVGAEVVPPPSHRPIP